MSHRSELFEFLCTFIDIQIKKYVSLATFGIGPDARLNAKLVFNEVNELLELTERLISEMEANPEDNSTFVTIFNQVKFYLDQEYVRAYAGWLLAENNIHSTVKERVSEQLNQLKAIAKLINLDTSIPSKPVTDVQKQCEHDSCAISFRILDLAQKIRSNPTMELDSKIPPHAQKVLKENATTRYVTFTAQIDELHTKYDEFLIHSELGKSSTELLKDEAKKHQIEHKARWDNLLKNYKNINPKSELFSPDHEWYKIGTNNQPKYYNNTVLFGGVAVASVLLIYMIKKYFTEIPDDSLHSTFNFN